MQCPHMAIGHAIYRRLLHVILSKKIINLNSPLGCGRETIHRWTYNQPMQITMARVDSTSNDSRYDNISTTWTLALPPVYVNLHYTSISIVIMKVHPLGRQERREGERERGMEGEGGWRDGGMEGGREGE